MRKAGLKRNIRRNKPPTNDNTVPNASKEEPNPQTEAAVSSGGDHPPNQLRRKLSNEEAALSTKNYRLAKELVSATKI